MSNFKIGQRVVCVETYNEDDMVNSEDPMPKKGDIFTVKGITPGSTIGLYFKELDSKYPYDASDFRPLDESFAEEVEANIAKQVKEEQMVEV